MRFFIRTWLVFSFGLWSIQSEAKPTSQLKEHPPTIMILSGSKIIEECLAQIKDQPDQKWAIVNDIDNTQTDARGRTFALIKQFAKKYSLKLPHDFNVSMIAYDGFQSAIAIGWSLKNADSFRRYWRIAFWQPQYFIYDLPVSPIIRYAQKAAKLGAEVFHLTGRDRRTLKGTIKQLKSFGIPFSDADHVLVKPIGHPTNRFKRSQLERLIKKGYRIAWFLTDTFDEIKTSRDLAVHPIYVDFPVKRKSPSSDDLKDIPVIKLAP